MFCPECRCEFRPGFTRCTDCDVDLVEALESSPDIEPDHDAPVTVFTANRPAEARLVRSLLEGSGLEVYMFDEYLPNIDFPVAILSGGIRIAVPRSQQGQAAEVLEGYRRAAEGGEGFAATDSDVS